MTVPGVYGSKKSGKTKHVLITILKKRLIRINLLIVSLIAGIISVNFFPAPADEYNSDYIETELYEKNP